MASVGADGGVKAEAEDEVLAAEAEVFPAEAEVVRGRVVRAVVLPCGAKGSFKGEAYEYAEPVQAEDGLSTPGSFFWVFRWLVDFLGGNQIPNFGGRSRATLLGRTASLLADGLSSSSEDEKEGEKKGSLDGEIKEEEKDDEAEDTRRGGARVPTAEQHLTVSSVMSRLSGAKRKSRGTVDDEDVELVKDELAEDPELEMGEAKAPRLRGDFSRSPLATPVWMSQLMVKGPRAGSRWMLDSAEVFSKVFRTLFGRTSRATCFRSLGASWPWTF